MAFFGKKYQHCLLKGANTFVGHQQLFKFENIFHPSY